MFPRDEGARNRMSGKIRQRGLLAIIIYFLMITAIWAPIGFYAGKAQGETQARNTSGTGNDLSLFETGGSDQPLESDGPHLYAPIVFLPGQTEAIRVSAARQRTPDGPRRNASLRQNPLRDSVLRALASDAAPVAPGGETSTDAPGGQPFSLAMAPDISAVFGGQPGAFGGAGGSTTASNGYPGAIIPGFLAAPPPPIDVEEPPVLATPVPAALPMFISGFAACWAAARRRRTR